ncbi:uncharacterized protein [Ranitomeya imitator]|uniref:uncharacterized protein isoform X2 n=1 Tax=Ranitomeya imitator TaxID=111125 RepID=UPI0037E8E043
MRELETGTVVLLLLSVWCRGEEQMTKVTGSSVTFRAGGDVQPSEITWLKDETKIVDLEEGKEPDFYGFYNIKDRVDANLTEKTFILRDVTPEDSGLYKAVLLVNGRITDLFFSLRVLDPVCKVSVQNTNVGNNVTLNCSCSSDGARPSQYKWQNVTHRVSDQQNLTVSMGKEPQTLWCVASNEVSSSEATVTVPRRGPDLDKRPHYPIIAAVLLILIVLVIIGLVLKFGFLDGRLLRSCRPERQQVPTTDPEDPEREDDVKKLGNDGAGAQESAENEEELKTQNNRNSEGPQDSAQKEEEHKIQKNGNVEAQDSEKEDETNTSML